MRTVRSSLDVVIPDGVDATIKGRTVTVKGPRGTLSKSFRHLRFLDFIPLNKGKKIRVQVWFGNRRQLACIRTVCAHIKNLITGVTKGYVYKMRLVYAHFPINATIDDDGSMIELRNFLGEKITRRVAMEEGVKVERSNVKDEIILSGNDIEAVSRSAALIYTKCLVRHKDVRKFLDGVYVSETCHVEGDDE
uniref:60S ribosomal protein L9-1 n=1 Tax=Stygiella incarcerata TaxID=1712417 RepID=A0A192ZIR6_9EUKA|nr:60S ribosomal protein L9-1 [Stygiella incarcerata]|eukprot:TRINITY_DN773_c0_g1_i2.p1 TRINITY_DN773_c0_g1~~TRINITY_DN773_c0_g1_i2.p1  ORF type:complete len:192 (+),score=49.91 TRINITY_DN773_c0_g1_i2:115-690(+)